MSAKLKAGIDFLARNEIWIVGAGLAASVAFTRLLPLAVGLALLFWPLRRLATRRFGRRTPLDWGIGLLALMLPVTLWATPLPGTTLPQVLRLASGLLFFYAVVNWASDLQRVRWLALGTAGVGSVLALIAMVSVDWFVNKLAFVPSAFYTHFTTAFADTIHPNVMAGYLVIFLPLAAALLLFDWRQLRLRLRIGLGLAFLLMFFILILTKSRGAWMGFGALVLLLVVLRWRRGWLLLPAGLLAGASVLVLAGIGPTLEALATSSEVSGVAGRVEIWSRAIYMIHDFSITGIGMGTFGHLADALYPFFLEAPGTIPHAHNLFLQVAVDLGIPGLIAWLSIFGLVTVCAWQVFRRGQVLHDAWLMALGAGFLGSQLAMAVHGVTDAVTWGMVRPAPLVWGLWGLAVACWNLYGRLPQETLSPPVETEPPPLE